MLSKIKQQLLQNPDKIIDLLEKYGYCNMVIHRNYISFGRDEFSSKKSIVINLENNDWLYVKDYARNYSADIFSFISTQRNVDFKDILGSVKVILGISDLYNLNEKNGVFGGFYSSIRKRSEYRKITTYSDDILDEYEDVRNLKFLKDHISFKTQKFFNIRYDTETNGIIIPIYTQFGELMGIKVRTNFDDENIDKYWYIKPCQMSNTLYGYSQNYSYLNNNTILIFESEKSVMQCHTYGIRNCVALGSGTISKRQCQMILELNPKKIIFMHDKGYDYEFIMKNVKLIKGYSRFHKMNVGFWDWENNILLPEKSSPSDDGMENLMNIINNEIKWIGDDSNESKST